MQKMCLKQAAFFTAMPLRRQIKMSLRPEMRIFVPKAGLFWTFLPLILYNTFCLICEKYGVTVFF